MRDREASSFFDPEKLHLLAHEGEQFPVRGPLNVSRLPQGHSVVVQTGSSEGSKSSSPALPRRSSTRSLWRTQWCFLLT